MEIKDLFTDTQAVLIDGQWTVDGKNAQEWLDWLNQSVSVLQPIEWDSLLIWANVDGRLTRITDASTNPLNSAELRSTCLSALILINSTQPLQLNKPGRAELVATLVTGNVLTAQDVADLQALATTTAPRWQSLGLNDEPFVGHIEKAIRSL